MTPDQSSKPGATGRLLHRPVLDGLHATDGDHEAAALLHACGHRRPAWIAVTHLSRDNNRPDLAIAAHLEAVGQSYPVYHASRYQTSELLTV